MGAENLAWQRLLLRDCTKRLGLKRRGWGIGNEDYLHILLKD